jgi:ATP:ADP antiporter, AAA family
VLAADLSIATLRLFLICFTPHCGSFDCRGTTVPNKPFLLISLAAFFLFGGYESVRSPSNTLFQRAYGADNFALVMSALPLVLIVVVSGYNLLLTRLKPKRTLLVISLGSALVLVALHSAITAGFAFATALLYLFRETYITLIVEQYWSYLDSIQEESAAKKFNAIFMGTVSVGSLCGGLLVAEYAQTFGTLNLVLFAAASTLLAAVFANWALRVSGEPVEEAAAEKQDSNLGLSAFKTIPTLRHLFGLVVCAQVVSTVLYLVFQHELQNALPSADAQTAYSGMFYARLNVVALVFQFILAPLFLRRLAPKVVQMGIPCVHLAGMLAIVVWPGLITASIAFALFKSLDYSLFRASKEILYIPLPYEARYRAKEWIDVVGYRMSKGGTSAILVGLNKLGLASAGLYPAAVISACTAWLFFTRKLTAPEPAPEPTLEPQPA